MRSRLRTFSYLETVGAESAAAPVGDHGKLAGRHELFEDLLDPAAAQARFPLQRGLVDAPLAVLIGVAGDNDEDEAMGASQARVVEDGIDMVKTQGGHHARSSRWLPGAGFAGARGRGGIRQGALGGEVGVEGEVGGEGQDDKDGKDDKGVPEGDDEGGGVGGWHGYTGSFRRLAYGFGELVVE